MQKNEIGKRFSKKAKIAYLKSMINTVNEYGTDTIRKRRHIQALAEAIRCVGLHDELITYIKASGGLFVCDCEECKYFYLRRKALLKKAKETSHD